MSPWIAEERRALIHPSCAGRSSLQIRASVIRPRSPTNTMRSRPKRERTFSICLAKVVGSPTFPRKHQSPPGSPCRCRSTQRVSAACSSSAAGMPEPGQRAGAALVPGRAQIVEHQRSLGQMSLAKAASICAWRAERQRMKRSRRGLFMRRFCRTRGFLDRARLPGAGSASSVTS